jgi:hypothetical protein
MRRCTWPNGRPCPEGAALTLASETFSCLQKGLERGRGGRGARNVRGPGRPPMKRKTLVRASGMNISL